VEEQTLKTNKLAEFIQVVEDWRERWKLGDRAIYRGHTDFNWILIAKLFRDPDAKPENEKGDGPNQISSSTDCLMIFHDIFMHIDPI
jgi:hypothetical protein